MEKVIQPLLLSIVFGFLFQLCGLKYTTPQFWVCLVPITVVIIFFSKNKERK